MWAFARESSFKRVLTEVLEKETHYSKEAEVLKNHILKNFTEEKMYQEFVSNVYNPSPEEIEWAEALDEIEIL